MKSVRLKKRDFRKTRILFEFKAGDNIALPVSPYGMKKCTSCNRRNTMGIARIAL